MRLGVLDVGSNTVHLLVVDAHRGAHPTPTTSEKTALRLAERISLNGALAERDVDELVATVAAAKSSAAREGCDALMAFATSAIREASNSDDVLARVRAETGIGLEVLPGEEEARFTFLAARRWFGWSAGRLLLLDIGGGSLEMAVGIDEQPELAVSLPLGAGRVARSGRIDDPPSQEQVTRTSQWLDGELAGVAERFRTLGEPDRVVATSKTFRTLARLTGAARPSAGRRVRRSLSGPALRQLLTFITRMSSADLATLDGVSAERAHQLVGGALVADAAMRALSVSELDLCPWALREGVILRRLDRSHGDCSNGDGANGGGADGDGAPGNGVNGDGTDEDEPTTSQAHVSAGSHVPAAEHTNPETGRKAQHRARWDR